jgi:hypothetical protein
MDDSTSPAQPEGSHVALVFASAQSVARRKDICRNCAYMTKTLNVMTCKQCGCAIDLKTRFAGTKCPVGQW